jgi:DNA (cytosine-5)-methyltransferase 1
MSTGKAIPIIDLFAGPGGLGEGFMSVVERGERRFRIALSIEKDEFAHRTLRLRSFTRQFPYKKLPPEYYKFLRQDIEIEELYEKYPTEFRKADVEAWRVELGSLEKHKEVDARIKESLKGEKNFLLIGGPPCQAYSLVGRARRQEVKGLNKEDERVYLYREYYRILAAHQPSVFIMENVKGLLSSRVENQLIFNQLIYDLQYPVESYKKLKGKESISQASVAYKIYSLVEREYMTNIIDGFPAFDPRSFIIRAEDYGIPQTRHRVILLGIRSDINLTPAILQRKTNVPVEKVLAGLPNIRSGLSKTTDSKDLWREAVQNINGIINKGDIPLAVYEKMIAIAKKLSVPRADKGKIFMEGTININYEHAWYLDSKIKGVCNHESRSHIIADLYRYLFVSSFASINHRSPKLSEFPINLLPKHENVNLGINENKFADRFRVQLRGQPSKTITSHISKDGHYYIHYDPSQCRSLTVREAARIQTFPDNYFFCGPRTEQFHQVGNAVPPLLARQMAKIVENIFSRINRII